MAAIRPVTRLRAQPATLEGGGRRLIEGSGAAESQAARIHASAHIGPEGAGVLVAQVAQVAGTGVSGNKGTGVLQAQSAQVVGRDNDAVLEADWQYRSSGSGVVWYHDFRTAQEVDAFRWAGGFGNDPGDTTKPDTVIHQTADGITGGGCLETFRPAGTTDGATWWRPFSSLQAPGNGKATDDPGASGTITARVWDSSFAGEMENHTFGFYGHDSLHATGQFDGTAYYLQFRLKLDSRRLNQAEGGKLLYHTINEFSLSQQEIVVEGYEDGGNGGLPMFSMYRSGGTPLDSASDNQPGNELGICDFPGSIGACWWWDVDNWDTVMFHIVPGVPGSTPQTQIEVFAAHSGEREYTRIWSQFVDMPMETAFARGYNAMIASQYMNGLNLTEFYHRYDQFIFSKGWIPCPGGAPSWFTALGHLEWTAPVGNWLGATGVKDTQHIGHEGIIEDWTGMLADQERRTIAMLANGGHAGYHGNEVYACDLSLDAPLWVRRRDATPSEASGTASFYEWSDGTPAPMHTNNSQISAAGRWFKLGMTGSLMVGNSREDLCWEYDPKVDAWISLGAIGSNSTSFGTCSMFYPQGPDGGLLIRASHDYTAYQSLNAPGVLFESGGGTPGNGSALMGDVDTDNHVMLTVQLSGVNNYRWRKLDSIAARTGSSTVLTATGSPPSVDSVGRWAMHYDPESGSFITWAGGQAIKKLTPTVDGSGNYTSLAWSDVTGVSGLTPPVVETKMYNKIQLIRDMGNGDRALVVVPRYGNPDVYVCRLKKGEPI